LADAAGTTVSMGVTQRSEQTQVALAATVSQGPAEAPNEAGEAPDLTDRFAEMLDAATNHDLDAVAEAWRGGSDLIANATHDEVDQVRWDSLYFENRFKAGATDALEDLKRLRDLNPSRFEPKRAMAHCYYASNEFDLAASLYLEVSHSQEGARSGRNLVWAAKAFREIKRYPEAIDAVKAALSIVPDD